MNNEYSIIDIYNKGLNFSFNLTLNRKTSLKMLAKIPFSVIRGGNLKKVILSKFTDRDLMSFYKKIYFESFKSFGEVIDIDTALPRKINTLLNFEKNEKAVSYLYNIDYDISKISKILDQTHNQTKHALLSSLRKMNEVYI